MKQASVVLAALWGSRSIVASTGSYVDLKQVRTPDFLFALWEDRSGLSERHASGGVTSPASVVSVLIQKNPYARFARPLSQNTEYIRVLGLRSSDLAQSCQRFPRMARAKEDGG